MRRNSHRTPVVHSCVEVPISTASQVDIVDAAEVGSAGLGTASVGEALELQEDIWNRVVFHSVLQEECWNLAWTEDVSPPSCPQRVLPIPLAWAPCPVSSWQSPWEKEGKVPNISHLSPKLPTTNKSMNTHHIISCFLVTTLYPFKEGTWNQHQYRYRE